MQQRTTKLGGLNCRIVDGLTGRDECKLAVVLCHGFGAPGTDLVPIGAELLQQFPELAPSVQFVFPEAPLSLDQFGMYGGRAWWYLDVNELVAAVERGETRILRDQRPEGLDESREMLARLVDELSYQTRLPMNRIVLGGFSQGSMLATDFALHSDEAPAALCIWSGTLLNEAVWKELAPRRKGLRVLQSHGRQDPILPFQAAEWLRDMLSEAGLNLEFIDFDGMHTIPFQAMERFGEMLGELSSGEPDA